MKLSITRSFFDIQTPDFAWKFIWIVEPNDKVQKYKNTKVQNTKQKSTKIQKCKKCKKYKKVKKVKHKKC